MSDRDYDPRAADRYHAYRQGWRDGAAGREQAKPFVEHATRPDMVAAYLIGYDAGGDDAAAALRFAQRKYKFTPSILRDGAIASTEALPRSSRRRP